jgi:hypothetical protein
VNNYLPHKASISNLPLVMCIRDTKAVEEAQILYEWNWSENMRVITNQWTFIYHTKLHLGDYLLWCTSMIPWQCCLAPSADATGQINWISRYSWASTSAWEAKSVVGCISGCCCTHWSWKDGVLQYKSCHQSQRSSCELLSTWSKQRPYHISTVHRYSLSSGNCSSL